jgi:Family of unknown function (DUF6152)
MRRQMAALSVGSALLLASGSASAHHSFAMFDQEHPIELEGMVQEFKYTSPHSYIILEVKGADGSVVIWNLEGGAPSLLTRDGWSRQTLKPGDEITITIHPLHSGAPGGSWQLRQIKYKNGQPLAITP